MVNYKKIGTGLCLVFCLAGCSKPSAKEPVPADLKKLGAVILSDRQSSRYDLGAGQTGVITPAVKPDGRLDLEIVIETTDVAGNVRRFTKPHVLARPGQKVTVVAGNIGLEFTPQLKTP